MPSQMHRTQKMIIAKLKSLFYFIRIYSRRRKINVYHISNPCITTQYHVEACPREVYLPGHLWDALNPTERFASVADLCAHVGDQLPIQVVKLIARDVLRGLEAFHGTRGVAHNGKLFFFFCLMILLSKILTKPSYDTRYQPQQHSIVSNRSQILDFSITRSDTDIPTFFRIISWESIRWRWSCLSKCHICLPSFQHG